jgi:hypothetical protein
MSRFLDMLTNADYYKGRMEIDENRFDSKDCGKV